MKKLFLILCLIIPLLTGCGSKTYEEIDYDTFLEKIENKDNFILFIGSETCQHCALYKSKVNKIIQNYNIMIYYIDINKFSDEQENKFKTYINFSGTPTTVFIENGEEKRDEKGNVSIYRINGNLDYEKVVDKIKKAGFIKE